MARGFGLAIEIDAAAETPLFLQVVRGIQDGIRRGRLRPGSPLPGTRALAERLEIHRNTVLAAYRELSSEGWIQASAARGTFVADDLPERPPRGPASGRVDGIARQPAFTLAAAPLSRDPSGVPPGTLPMVGGMPDLRLFPAAALSRAYRRALRSRARELLAYGDPRGHRRLRTALASMLAEARGIPAGADDLVVTRGSQMAIELAARALLRPGDLVAVEAFGYPPAWEALSRAGARVVPVPVDGHGLRVDRLAELAAREPVRALYVTPHHQFPTGAPLVASRRLALLSLAAERRFAVLEDDYHHEFQYEGRPILPLAASDRAGSIVYVGSLSKVLAPGLRLGFVCAPRPLLDRIADLRLYADRQGDHAVEYAVAELIEDGELPRHIRRARRVYRARRDLLAWLLRERIGPALSFRLPPGGMTIWARVRGVDADAWTLAAREEGVHVHAGRRFAFDGRRQPFLRLGFAALDERELREGVERLRRGLDRVRGQSRRSPRSSAGTRSSQ